MSNFFWTKDINEAKKEQQILVNLVQTVNTSFRVDRFNTGLAIGTAYEENTKVAFAVSAVFNKKGEITDEINVAKAEIDFPYVPGLLAFRVGAAVCSAIDKTKKEVDLFLFDGQGIAHPTSFGLATHIGVLYNKPSIGVTKKSLFGIYTAPPKEGFYFTELKHPQNKLVIGYCLSSGGNNEHFFMSPGHQITLSDSLSVIKIITDSHFLPRPIRVAHAIANRCAREYWENIKNKF